MKRILALNSKPHGSYAILDQICHDDINGISINGETWIIQSLGTIHADDSGGIDVDRTIEELKRYEDESVDSYIAVVKPQIRVDDSEDTQNKIKDTYRRTSAIIKELKHPYLVIKDASIWQTSSGVYLMSRKTKSTKTAAATIAADLVPYYKDVFQADWSKAEALLIGVHAARYKLPRYLSGLKSA